MSQTNNAVTSGLWVFARIFVTKVSRIFVIAVLARRLDPADFGVVALALVVFQLLTLPGAEGVNQFVVHDTKEGREERCQAVFWMDLLFACGSTTVGFLLLPYLGMFSDDLRLSAILSVLLFIAPVNSLSRVPDALLRKEFKFKQVEIRDLSIALGIGAIAVTMVLLDYGVWSLVVPALIGAVAKAIAVYQLCEWRPKARLYLSRWPRVFAYYRSIIGAAATSFVVTQGDTALVGKLFGTAVLGFYNVAWQGANLVNNLVVMIGNQLALPVLARVGDGPDSIEERGVVLLRVIRTLASLTFPMFVVLFVVADVFVLTIFGEQWGSSVVIMKILLIYALRYALSPAIGAFFSAIARPEVMFRLGMFTIPFYIAGILVGANFGILGVAVAVAAVRTASGLVGFALAARILNMAFPRFVQPMLPPLMAAILVGGTLHYIKFAIVPAWLPVGVTSLFVLVTLGAVLYWLLVRCFFQVVFEDLCHLAAKTAGPRFGWLVRVIRLGARG